MALWCYTDLADSRWSIGTKYIQLRQARDSASKFEEQMLGIFNPSGWGAYFRNSHLFVKKAKVETGAKYPDFGCNFELYTDTHSLELETLGPFGICSRERPQNTLSTGGFSKTLRPVNGKLD